MGFDVNFDVEIIETKVKFRIYENWEEFSETEISLFSSSIAASKKAYAPYSKFQVGASVLLESGEIVKGNNQENGAFPSGLCAERVAIFSAGANHPKERILGLAITINYDTTEFKDMAFPCGACRQSILEYEIKQSEPIKLYVIGKDKRVLVSDNISQLLPLCFKGDFLREDS